MRAARRAALQSWSSANALSQLAVEHGKRRSHSAGVELQHSLSAHRLLQQQEEQAQRAASERTPPPPGKRSPEGGSPVGQPGSPAAQVWLDASAESSPTAAAAASRMSSADFAAALGRPTQWRLLAQRAAAATAAAAQQQSPRLQ
jgi:hypothetical protein